MEWYAFSLSVGVLDISLGYSWVIPLPISPENLPSNVSNG
jgi:hypothetical protein